ncbi:MAG: Coenzyme F420 hydrogenase/dehydrogenase, beta subunit C-terminal domain [Theionarchaea archaeon]|nr:Coenzyme F420 hydrogenase/dehydrogenase, beta subunit C-terminal domain [Theionarchaea archaeon]
MRSVTEEIVTIPLDVVHDYEQEACSICPDFTSELADLSIGSIGSTKGWSTVIVRTPTGNNLFTQARDEGYIEVQDSSDLYLKDLIKFSSMKKTRSLKNIVRRKKNNLPIPFFERQ